MTEPTITLLVNDERRTFTGGATVDLVVHALGLTDRKGVAVAVNGGVVPRSAWPTHRLTAADKVLVIRATQGG